MIKDFQKSAIIVGDRNVSYSEMLQRIHLFSQYTKGEKGDRVLILSENREGWIYAFFSVWARQEIATPVDAILMASRTKSTLVREVQTQVGRQSLMM